MKRPRAPPQAPIRDTIEKANFSTRIFKLPIFIFNLLKEGCFAARSPRI